MKRTITIALVFAFGMSASVFAQSAKDVHPDKQPLVPENLTNPNAGTLSVSTRQLLAREALDRLFGKLHRVKSAKRARFLSSAIWKIWNRSGSSTADLLMVQAERAMGAGQQEIAILILSTVVDQYPEFTEARNKRATAFYIARDYEQSIVDIMEVLKREPRHFGALSGLGLIYQQQGKKKKALSAFRRALAIHPHLKDIKRAVKKLSGKIEQDI